MCNDVIYPSSIVLVISDVLPGGGGTRALVEATQWYFSISSRPGGTLILLP